jgi:hypothetical protein
VRYGAGDIDDKSNLRGIPELERIFLGRLAVERNQNVQLDAVLLATKGLFRLELVARV